MSGPSETKKDPHSPGDCTYNTPPYQWLSDHCIDLEGQRSSHKSLRCPETMKVLISIISNKADRVQLSFTSSIRRHLTDLLQPPSSRRWSPCSPGSCCTTPSRRAATSTAATSTRESRTTSAPLRSTRGPSHTTTACKSDPDWVQVTV